MKCLKPRGRAVALLVCLTAFCGGEASAADLYDNGPSLKDAPFVPPPLSWEGFYVGGNVGGAWNTTVVDDKYDYIGDPSSRNTLNGSGVIAGGQIGYNFQSGNLVFGPEIDLGYLGLPGSKSTALTPSPDCLADNPAYQCVLNGNYKTSGGFYGDITGRLGYAVDNVLFYAKGGVAFLDLNVKSKYVGQNCSVSLTELWHCQGYTVPNQPSVFNFEHSDTLWGWTVGGGVEYALNQEWSVKIEYQHFDFGSTSFNYEASRTITGTNLQSTISGEGKFSPSVDAVKVGVNYHLDLFSGLK